MKRVDTDLTEIAPIERRVDGLFEMESDQGRFVFALESQSRQDPGKHSAWAFYLSCLHARHRSRPVLVVLCQDRATARWAARPIDLGLPGWPSLTIRPLVLGPENVPFIADEKEAAEDIALASFSAITHGKSPSAAAILEPLAQALSTADADVGTVFAELVEAGLGSNSRALDQWRTLMQTLSPFFKSRIAEEYGREKHEEGREEGEAHGRARSLLDVLHHRGLTVPDTAAAHILACHDLPTLDHWWHHAFTARTVDELLTDPADGR